MCVWHDGTDVFCVFRRSAVRSLWLCALVCAVTLWYREHWVLGVTNHTHVGYMRER